MLVAIPFVSKYCNIVAVDGSIGVAENIIKYTIRLNICLTYYCKYISMEYMGE